MTDSDFATLIARAKAGDDSVFPLLLEHFEPEVRTFVRVRLPKALRSEFDSIDFVQSVWKSFVDGWTDGIDRFENPEHLLGYLAGIARNKVLTEYRRRTKTKRFAIQREESLHVRRGDLEYQRDVAGTEPTPSQNVQAEDCWERLREGLDDRDVAVVELRRDGMKLEAIAERTGLSERAVRRVLESVRRSWEARQ